MIFFTLQDIFIFHVAMHIVLHEVQIVGHMNRQIAVNAENSQTCNTAVGSEQKPRKPSSAYFYFIKKHRCRLQQQHPTWPMKRIVSSVAMLWSKTSLQNRAPFVEMAKEDSNIKSLVLLISLFNFVAKRRKIKDQKEVG